jgi:hypothetical protein
MNARFVVVTGFMAVAFSGCPAEEDTGDAQKGDTVQDTSALNDANEDSCPHTWTKEAFTTCAASPTAADCTLQGGTWGLQGLTQIESCGCPTGQGGCPCNRASDCLGRCIFMESPSGVSPSKSCDGITSFACTERHTTGCHCEIMDDGQVGVLCVD